MPEPKSEVLPITPWGITRLEVCHRHGRRLCHRGVELGGVVSTSSTSGVHATAGLSASGAGRPKCVSNVKMWVLQHPHPHKRHTSAERGGLDKLDQR